MTKTTPCSTAEVIRLVFDASSFASWDAPIGRADGGDQLGRADEAVRTGEATVQGRRVAVIAGESDFLAGTIGQATVGRMVAAIDRATARRLALLALPISGGTRVQEGTPASVGMIEIVLALGRHRHCAAGLPYLLYLRGPTTGRVLASWASLSDVTFAEPGAFIVFLGPRVQATLPTGAIRTECRRRRTSTGAGSSMPSWRSMSWRRRLAGRCGWWPTTVAPIVRTGHGRGCEPHAVTATWTCVERTRRPDRPRLRDFLGHACRDVVSLHGTGEGERGDGMLLALARLDSHRVVVLGPDRDAEAPLDPAAFRVARRGIRLAVRIGLPVVSVVDTPGAEFSAAAEEGGVAAAMVLTLAGLAAASVPTVSILLGEGTGGGGLALLAADAVVAAQHAWLAPLAPETAAALLYCDSGRAGQAATIMRIRAADLRASGLVDYLVAGCPDAAEEPEPFLTRLGRAVECALHTLTAVPSVDRIAARARRLELTRLS